MMTSTIGASTFARTQSSRRGNEQLREYTLGRVSSLVDIGTSNRGTSDFVELGNLVYSRLTLINVRNGGEPSRMVIE